MLVLIISSTGVIGYLSYRYSLPVSDVTESCARYTVLMAISMAVQVYDPVAAKTIHAPLAPKESLAAKDATLRIEDYLAKRAPQGLEVVNLHNERIVKSRFAFSYQPDVPRLRQMREEMGLDKIVADAGDELEKMILLRRWVRSQFSRRDYKKRMENFDALAIWKHPQRNTDKRAKKPDEYNPCHFFPLFYSQVLMAMGFNPRMVGITHTGYGAHGFVEVWSNQYKKWISMDPDLNLHYELDGVPQNMLEVHNARYDADCKMVLRQEMIEPGIQPLETIEGMISYHRYIKIGDMRNDWLTNAYFPGHPYRSDQATLFWKDPRQPEVWSLYTETSDPHDMYWTLDQAEIHADPAKSTDKVLELVFKTVTPNFSHYVVTVNGEEHIIKSYSYSWRIEDGLNELSVYPVNSFGVEGIKSHVILKSSRK